MNSFKKDEKTPNAKHSDTKMNEEKEKVTVEAPKSESDSKKAEVSLHAMKSDKK